MADIKDIAYCGQTSVGRVRTNNEDNYTVQPIWDGTAILAIVADGLGGYEGGEVASLMLVEHVARYLDTYRHGDRLELLRQAVIAANNAIIDRQRQTEGHEHMATVATVALVEPAADKVYMAHVGDTRLYCYHDGQLEKLSHDHTLVGYKEECGELTEAEAMVHPQRNVINKVLGATNVSADSNSFVELNSFPLRHGSTLLLCSDGLFDLIDSTAIAAVLESRDPLEHKAQALIDAANEAGGRDNITVLLLYCEPVSVPADPTSVHDEPVPVDPASVHDEPVPAAPAPSAPNNITEPDTVVAPESPATAPAQPQHRHEIQGRERCGNAEAPFTPATPACCKPLCRTIWPVVCLLCLIVGVLLGIVISGPQCQCGTHHDAPLIHDTILLHDTVALPDSTLPPAFPLIEKEP